MGASWPCAPLGDCCVAENPLILGKTGAGRRLTVVFTIRGSLVRPIMARDMSRRERRFYAEQEHAEEGP